MKKRLLFYLLLLLQALATPAIATANPDHLTDPPSDEEATNCVAPPPAWLIVTQATPTSISLMWEQNQLNMLFKVEGRNVTGGFDLPTYYTTSNTITYYNLTGGDLCLFSVSATYCPQAPQFDENRKISIYKWVPRIIIDAIVQVNAPCTLGDEEQTYLNEEFQICAGTSSNYDEPFTSAYIGRVKDNNNNILDFAVAYNGQSAFVGEISDNSLFSFSYAPNNKTIVDCYTSSNGFSYKVLTISNLSTDVEATLNLKFWGTYSFQYCDGCSGGERSSGSDPSGSPSEKTAPSPENPVLTQVSPNPFNESTTFRYALAEPGPVEISLYDAMGRLVKVVEKTTQQAAGEYSATVDGADLPEGVYFLHTITGQNRQVFSLVKQE